MLISCQHDNFQHLLQVLWQFCVANRLIINLGKLACVAGPLGDGTMWGRMGVFVLLGGCSTTLVEVPWGTVGWQPIYGHHDISLPDRCRGSMSQADRANYGFRLVG